MEPTQKWYRSMNRFYVEEKLREYPFLIKKYGSKYSSFKSFCFLVMDRFGWQDIEVIQEEFDTENFYGLNFIRMYQTNVKKWQTISREVFKRDSYTCHYCGQIGGILEVDHKIPFSKGGSDDLDNLVTSCRKCNRQKKDMSIADFLKWREKNE